jgi:hypothetical protein
MKKWVHAPYAKKEMQFMVVDTLERIFVVAVSVRP